ncbi:MAG: GYDIA family GHMP kinase [Bacteroidales bacterium]
MMIRFQAHGKLLLSAEYMVMHGATALAVPLNLGQTLDITHTDNNKSFSWKAYFNKKLWFGATFDPATLRIIETTNPDMSNWLKRILQACIEIMPSFQGSLFRKDAVTNLDFSPDYGFGSSSTLISLLAEWAEVNPLDLHFMVSEGSGYDVACALADGPITYKLRDELPQYQHIPFHPSFSEHLWFAWLGKKQATASHLQEVARKINPGFETIYRFSELTRAMIEAPNLDVFRMVMEAHEDELSRILGMDRVSSRFSSLKGSVKSLGAWGGDFVMIATETDPETLRNYLANEGIRVLYNFNELVYEKGEF